MMNFMPPHEAEIIVGLSGGVDSAIAAYLLQQAGYRVKGVFMKNWDQDEEGECTAAIDLADAEAVSEHLSIDLTVVNFADLYWQKVFVLFLHEYRLGHTPNPDVWCNKEIKFKAFLAYAHRQGAHYIATGHYARLVHVNNTVCLYQGIDADKDQSYFLHALTTTQLAHSVFPLGALTKRQVRCLAKEISMPNHAKKDSTGICFIGERKFKNFLSHYLQTTSGVIENINGEVIGHHHGLSYYTIGQRQGLQIGGCANKAALPWYVVAKDLARNVLIVAQGNQHPALFTHTTTVAQIHWIHTEPSTFPFTCQAKTRYRQAMQACSLMRVPNQYYRISFAVAQRALTPGQFIVFYQGEQCLGGGVIQATEMKC